MKLAVLYAGQGAQHPGMGKEFYESSPAFRAAFDSAALDFDLHRVCFEDPDGVLNQTEYTQPCMVAFACGVTAVLAEHGVQPAYVAGLSLGEYSALEAAGVFTAKQAIELAAYRGKAMAEAAKGIDCGMTAVLGLDRTALSACCEQASALGCVQICNYNCPGQLVIGGEKAAVEQAAALAGTIPYELLCAISKRVPRLYLEGGKVIDHNLQDVITLAVLLIKLARLFDAPLSAQDSRDRYSLGRALEKRGDAQAAEAYLESFSALDGKGRLVWYVREHVEAFCDEVPSP